MNVIDFIISVAIIINVWIIDSLKLGLRALMQESSCAGRISGKQDTRKKFLAKP